MIYFLRAEQHSTPEDPGGRYWVGSIKIGTTIRLSLRLKQIAAKIGHTPKVLAVMDGSYAEERALHERFALYADGNEWFSPNEELLQLIATEGRLWDGTDEADDPSQARLELPSADMERARKAAKSIGLGLSAFIRQAVLEKTVDVARQMGI